MAPQNKPPTQVVSVGTTASGESVPGPCVGKAVQPDAIDSGESLPDPTLLMSLKVAQRWFEDAVRAAGTDDDLHRHEILFAVCFAEAWLVEWARDVALFREKDGYRVMRRLFFTSKKDPNKDYRRCTQKWTEVASELHKDGYTEGEPTPPGQDWSDLLEYRNGLVHGHTSHWYTSGDQDRKRTATELRLLPNGWAIHTAFREADKLRLIVSNEKQTQWPGWLQLPLSLLK